MTEEVTYFQVAGFLADIEDQYAEISDPTARSERLIERLRQKWPSLSANQAVAYVQVFTST